MYNSPYQRHFEIDTAEYPVVVIESDDWGACELIPSADLQENYFALMKKYDNHSAFCDSGLETPDQMRELFAILAKHKGADGNSAVFTAYTAMGNPDFEAIEANNFTKYIDIPINKGFPAPWQGEGIIDTMLEGMKLGVWQPEYHAMLHHTSPRLWLKLLNESSPAGEFARELFKMRSYYQMKHIPEFHGYNIHEQYELISTGFRRFKETFGYEPNAAVTSDAFPETELVWQALGINTIPLKNSRVNTGEVVVYPTKPWNMQDVYAKIGDCSKIADACYLIRNVFCEASNTAEEVLKTIDTVLKIHKEPAVISTHRCNYCTFNEEARAKRMARLDEILTELDKQGVYYLTSAELSSIYRKGYSERRIGDKILLRKWFENAAVPAYTADLPKGNHFVDATEQTEIDNDYQI